MSDLMGRFQKNDNLLRRLRFRLHRIRQTPLIKVQRKVADQSKGKPAKPYPVYADDIFFVSYPRSGSAWFRRLIATVLDPKTVWGLQNINKVMPDMYVVGSQLANYPRPRIIKSHEAFQPSYPKVVYLYRDGRDVAVSYYNVYHTTKGFKGTFDQFLRLFIEGHVDFGKWDEHIVSWIFGDNKDCLLTLSYEDLYENTQHTLNSAMRFLGFEVTQEAINTAIRRCTFKRHVEDLKRHSLLYQQGFKGGVKGAPGKWCEVFTEDQLARFWDAMGATMEQLGYNLNPTSRDSADSPSGG
jgi:hypothetical protein